MSPHPRSTGTSLSCLLLAVILMAACPGRAGADEPTPEGFVAAQAVELPGQVVVEMDGAGAARVSWRGQAVARIDLLLVGGRAEDPADWSERELSVNAGAHLPRPGLLQVALVEGERPGMRGPGKSGDDDQDARVDEDPFDGLDNDGDGDVDEDYAAIGFRMRVSLADLDGVGLPGFRLRPRTYQWPYFHVDDSLFWDVDLLMPEDEALVAAPGARVRTAAPLSIQEIPVRPHLSVGRGEVRRVRLPYARIEGEDGARLYVGVLRLDGRGAEILPDQSGVIWEAGSDVHWPLAIVTAPTFDVLLHNAGQALLTYGEPGHEARWTVPPICARCQRAEIDNADLDLTEDGDSFLLLHLELSGLDEHAAASHEGLAIADSRPLAPFLVRDDDRGASYRVPRDSAAGRELLVAAALQELDVEVMLHSGIVVRPEHVRLTVAPALLAEIEQKQVAKERELPSHLSPDLLETWPNPFHEATAIQFRVPATLGEAFDFEETMTTGLDLTAAAPFGSNPMVRVKVYNVGGQLIRLLDEARRGVGEYSVSWDGSDEQGRPVAAGAYYVNVEVGEYTVTRRVLRLKP